MPGQALRVPGDWGSQISNQWAHDGGKAVSLTYRPLLPQGNIPGTHFCWRLGWLQGHSAAGRIMSMKNFNDTIGNRTRDLPACSAVPQPTAPLRVPVLCMQYTQNYVWIFYSLEFTPSQRVFSVKHVTDGADLQNNAMRCSIFRFQIYYNSERHFLSLCIFACLRKWRTSWENTSSGVADSVSFSFTGFFALQRVKVEEITWYCHASAGRRISDGGPWTEFLGRMLGRDRWRNNIARQIRIVSTNVLG